MTIRIISCALLAALALAAAPEEPPHARQKAQLQPLQDFIGAWKGAGQRERGKTEGGWIENATWAWKFDKENAAIAFTAKEAKFLAAGEFRPGQSEGAYSLHVTGPDGKAQAEYQGKLAEGKLVLESEKPADGMPQRITLRLTAEGKRLVALYESKSTTSDRYVRLAEVGYTRVGSGFGQGAQGPECIITGGLGTIAVAHKGKTYYVCCTGCKDYFDEDPQRAIDEYLAKKK